MRMRTKQDLHTLAFSKKAGISLMKARTCIIQVPSESVKKRQNYLHHRAHYEFRPKNPVLHRQRMRKTSFPIR